MGSRSSRPVVTPDNALRSMKRHQVAVLEAQFRRLTAQPDVKGSVRRDLFIRDVLEPRFPGFSPMVWSRAFQVVDTNGNGTVEWEEFVVVMFIFKHALRDDRMRFLFHMYDLDGNSQVSRKELKKIAQVLQAAPTATEEDLKDKQLSPIVELMSKTAISCYDRNNDGSLSFIEWRRYAEEDDLIQLADKTMRRVKSAEIDVKAAVALKAASAASSAVQWNATVLKPKSAKSQADQKKKTKLRMSLSRNR
eukprot:TRINITY_DN113822_c0_g1_i1.p1 TRINITY_DN113822_c0_g1~~TRINITY_DN113822_c0_g1_i1.p1  ORF type:complete len:262 (+),score=123.50 TRINITY_DN113822_c0_g1_i1:42-788(+)